MDTPVTKCGPVCCYSFHSMVSRIHLASKRYKITLQCLGSFISQKKSLTCTGKEVIIKYKENSNDDILTIP